MPTLEEKNSSNNLILNLKELEKKGQSKPIVSRGKEIVNIRAEIKEIETRKTIGKKQQKELAFKEERQMFN